MGLTLLGFRVINMFTKKIMNFGIQLNLYSESWLILLWEATLVKKLSRILKIPWWSSWGSNQWLRSSKISVKIKDLKFLSGPWRPFKHFAHGSCLDIWKSWGILAKIKRYNYFGELSSVTRNFWSSKLN